jgi:hypothetical protein
VAEDRHAWIEDAECKQLAPELAVETFFPLAAGGRVGADRRPYRIGSEQDPYRVARTICAACPVVRPCIEYGLGERDGMFGGMDERQHHAERKRRRLPILP